MKVAEGGLLIRRNVCQVLSHSRYRLQLQSGVIYLLQIVPYTVLTKTTLLFHESRKSFFLRLEAQGTTMNMAMQAAPPRRPPASPQRKSVSPNKKQRPSLSLVPTTRRPSIALTTSFNKKDIDVDGVDNDFGFAEKNALFQSFSDLCHDVGFSDKNALSPSFPDLCLDDDDFLDRQEDEEKEPQKQDFMASLVDFLDSDEILDDSKLNKMVTEWQASTDAVAGGTKEEVEFNTSLASLFGSFTDLLTNKRGFDKKECLTLQQEMERLKKMRRRMAMATEFKPDFSGFPEAPHSPTTRSRKPVTLGRQHESVANVLEYALEGWQGDVVPLQEEQGKREEEVLEEQKRGTENRGDPVISPSRSSGIEKRGEPVTPRSRSPTRRLPTRRSPKSPSRRLHKSNDDDGNSGKPHQSGSSVRRETSADRHHRRSKPSGAKATEHSSPVRSSQRRASPRPVTPLPGDKSSLMLSPRHPSKQRDPLGVSSHHSKSPRKRIGLAATLHTSSSRKEDGMSLSGTTTHTSRSMPASRSPRKSSRTSGQSDPIRSHNTPRQLRSKASSLEKSPKSPRKALEIYLLGVSSLKSPNSPRKSFQKDSMGAAESIRSVQLYGTPRRPTEKGSTGRTSAKPDKSPSSLHHLERMNGRSSVPDSPKTVTRRSSQEGKPRTQSQTGSRTTLSLKELVPPVYSSAEKEDLAPKQPSRGRRNSQERQPTSRNRGHSMAPDAEKESRSSSRRSSSIATSGTTSSSRRRSNSVAPETGSPRVRSNSVTRDAKKSSGRSHLDLVSRSQHRASRRPSLGSIQSSML
jgi:hypothetical protein